MATITYRRRRPANGPSGTLRTPFSRLRTASPKASATTPSNEHFAAESRGLYGNSTALRKAQAQMQADMNAISGDDKKSY